MVPTLGSTFRVIRQGSRILCHSPSQISSDSLSALGEYPPEISWHSAASSAQGEVLCLRICMHPFNYSFHLYVVVTSTNVSITQEPHVQLSTYNNPHNRYDLYSTCMINKYVWLFFYSYIHAYSCKLTNTHSPTAMKYV